MLVEFTAGTAMQSQLAHELLESRRAFGLPGNVFQDGRVGEHGAISYQLSGYRTRLAATGNLSSGLDVPVSEKIRIRRELPGQEFQILCNRRTSNNSSRMDKDSTARSTS